MAQQLLDRMRSLDVGPARSPIGAIVDADPLQLLSEDDCADFLVDNYGDDIRYCAAAGGWLVWDGRRFARDVDKAIMRIARANTDRILELAEGCDVEKRGRDLLKFVAKMRLRRSMENVVELTSAKLPIATGSPERFDVDTLALNVQNGTVDLATGSLRRHNRGDLMSRMIDVPFDADATAPRWERCLREIFAGDGDLVAFFARAVGYSLTGSTTEHVFFVLHGRGANGKTTIVETLLHLFGDYAQASNPETWLRQASGTRGADPGLARLPGVRMVATSEISEGRRLDESRVKSIVSGDRTACRQLYCPEFVFTPIAKLWFSTNYVPEIRGTDDGIWRRVLLIPFTQQFTGVDADPHLGEKLRAELPGILAWAVRGCMEWQRVGLAPPERVRRATSDYRLASDVVGRFVADECLVDPRCSVGAGEIFSAFRSWAERSGEAAITQNMFGRRLGDGGYRKERQGSGRIRWHGVGLLAEGGSNDSNDSRPNTESVLCARA